MSLRAENRPEPLPRNSGRERAPSVVSVEGFGTLIGGLTHDFNNLFGLIIGNLELLRDPQTTEQESLDISHDALEAATRGAEMTRDLVAYAQRQRLDPRPIALNEFVATVAQTLGAKLGKHIEVELDLATAVWPAIADPVQLDAALVSLATNAAVAMPKGGRLKIATANRRAADEPGLAPGDYATIALTDTGPGIAPELADRMFEPFAAKGGSRGTGLRLGAIFGFMKQSRGHITVASTAGGGATFTLYLPHADAIEASRHEGAPATKTVLVIEHDLAARQLAVQHLTALGYGVVAAANTAVALATLETEPAIDLLLGDAGVPGEADALALARMVVRRWPKVKIVVTSKIVVSGIDDHEADARIRLLAKPYGKDDLARMLHEILHVDAAARHGA